jgi:hypothetical protein
MEQARRPVEGDEVLFSAGAWARRQTMRSRNSWIKHAALVANGAAVALKNHWSDKALDI